jgi:tyramine---L-glutamate ligase
LKIIVYEYISGGGYAGQPIPSSFLAEGFGMLRTIVSDFKAAGHETTIFLDDRISKLNPPIAADITVPIFYPHEPENFLANITKVNDAVFVIAPETNHFLKCLVELVEKAEKISFNCESSAIQKAADKTVLYQILEENKIPIPKTIVLDVKDDLAKIKQCIKNVLQYPLVFKPADGVGCSGLSILEEEGQIVKAVERIKANSVNDHFIVQEYAKGEAASVSLLCTKDRALAISLNHQTIKFGAPEESSSYEGGAIPFDHRLKQDAFAIAEKVANCFAGLRGYVGVDLVLTNDKVFVVDVNPRLTTSYVGLSRVANFNVAQAIVNATLKEQLPTKPKTTSYACFSKTITPSPTISAFQKIAQVTEVISPPFPVNDTTCMLVIGHGDSLETAGSNLEEAKKLVLNIISKGD